MAGSVGFQTWSKANRMMGMAKMAKKDLHELVDALPATEVPAAKRYLQYLRDMGDPVLRAARSAPIDDEPETPEERLAVAEAREAIAQGKVLTDEQLRRELGL